MTLQPGWKYLIVLCLAGISLNAQVPGFGLVSSGYSVPPSSITASPGQVVVVSVYGSSQILPQPLLHGPLIGILGEALPTQLGVFTVTFTQGTNTVAVPLFGVSQSRCPSSQTSCTVTNITLQVPYEMNLSPSGAPALTIRENGVALGSIPLTPVPDRVHVLSSCDVTAIATRLLGADTAPPCTAAVTHASGQLVTDANPARPGEQVVMYLYGLGATSPGARTGSRYFTTALEVTRQTYTLSFDFRPNSLPVRPIPVSSALTTPVFAGLPPAAIGVYQVNFVIPSPPPGNFSACDGTFISSNLTVSVLGSASYDGAQICITR